MTVHRPVRKSVAVPALLTALAAVLWLGLRGSQQTQSLTQLAAGQPYAVDVSSGSTTLDLPFHEGSRYLLIVSSLASADGRHTVSLSARPTDVVRVAGRPLAALQARPTTREPAPAPPAAATPHSPGSLVSTVRAVPKRPAPPRERLFHLHVTDGSLEAARHYAGVRGRVVAEGRQVRVYLDTQLKVRDLASGLLDDIVNRFDQEIIPLARRWLGTYRDVDGDGRFAVLLTGWLSRLEGGRTSLGGFVRAADFRRDLEAPFSNRCDMMYLNADLQPGPHLGSLLAHEFAHAVCFSERIAGGESLPDEDDWLNEAIAHIAENLYGASWSNLDYRLGQYLSDPAQFPLVVPDYYDAGLWRNHGCRGATFLLLRWCVDQFGEDLLKRLIHGRHTGVRNLESATGFAFEELYRHWTVALACADPAAPGAFRSIDLQGTLSGWGLGGPRIETWNVTGDGRMLVLKGTSTAFVELHAGHGDLHRIRVEAAPGAKLQLTLIPVPPESPRLSLSADWSTAHDSSPGRSPRSSALRLNALAGTDVEIEWVSCEQQVSDSRASCCWSAEELSRLVSLRESSLPRTTTSLVAAPVPALETRSYSLHLPLPSRFNQEAPLLVKMAARDPHGRRTVAWAMVPPGAISPESPVRLATRSVRRTVERMPSRDSRQNR